MESNILNKIGLDSIDPFIFIIILTGLVLILLLWNILQNIKIKNIEENYETFFIGNEEISMAESMEKCFEQMGYLIQTNKERNKITEELYHAIAKCYQKSGIVKYDALKEMGGQLSFAFAMLDNENSGYVYNVVNTKEGCFVYTKAVMHGVSEGALSEEEEEALQRAEGIDHLKKYEILRDLQQKKDRKFLQETENSDAEGTPESEKIEKNKKERKKGKEIS